MKERPAGEMPFEEALKRLEAIVRDLEGGDLPLEESLKIFEEGVRLTRHCARKLDEAERKVEILLKDKKGKRAPRPFRPEETTFEDEAEG
jgi:exodeoxyribonuclease VII small subunit